MVSCEVCMPCVPDRMLSSEAVARTYALGGSDCLSATQDTWLHLMTWRQSSVLWSGGTQFEAMKGLAERTPLGCSIWTVCCLLSEGWSSGSQSEWYLATELICVRFLHLSHNLLINAVSLCGQESSKTFFCPHYSAPNCNECYFPWKSFHRLITADPHADRKYFPFLVKPWWRGMFQ